MRETAMALKPSLTTERPLCPKCGLSMLVVDGFGLSPEQKTFECLGCGRIRKPTKSAKRSKAVADV
jgi:tRNA(Ile2) C34 agmatinyltransferase TiaS